MPAPIVPREEVARRLFGVFRTYGFEGATLARLSEATGLGRASLYHYFPDGKSGMVREVLGVARAWIEANLAAPLRGAGSPASRLRAVAKNLIAGYDDGNASCVCNLLGVGDARDASRDELRDAARAYVDAFGAFLESCGLKPARARAAAIASVVNIQGALVVARALDDPRVFVKQIEHLEKELLAAIRDAKEGA
jgi:AcrR family transcriptional regulator